MSLRKFEREVTATKTYNETGKSSKFRENWDTYRKNKYGDNVPRDTSKKKQRHLDNADQFVNALRYKQALFRALVEQKKAEKEATNTEVVADETK